MKSLNKIKQSKTPQKAVSQASLALKRLLMLSRKSSFLTLKTCQKTTASLFQTQQKLFSRKSLKKLEIRLTTQWGSCAMRIFSATQSLLKWSSMSSRLSSIARIELFCQWQRSRLFHGTAKRTVKAPKKEDLYALSFSLATDICGLPSSWQSLWAS